MAKLKLKLKDYHFHSSSKLDFFSNLAMGKELHLCQCSKRKIPKFPQFTASLNSFWVNHGSYVLMYVFILLKKIILIFYFCGGRTRFLRYIPRLLIKNAADAKKNRYEQHKSWDSSFMGLWWSLTVRSDTHAILVPDGLLKCVLCKSKHTLRF